ncbi:MAG: S9 family peptidase [Gemmatimonadetes bacterium]|nr:S9 family peptidase [Gemmatimonadota bacterium]
MRTTLLSAALLGLIASSAASQTTRRPMTTDDGLDMINVGGALMSPDGEWVFYSESRLDWDENKRESTYFMVPAAGGEAFRFIGKEGGSAFQFSPDGLFLSFRRTVDSTQQLFLMRTNGGEAVQLTKHEASVESYRWSHDSRRIFFVADEARDEDEEKEHKNGNDAIFVDEGPNGQRESQWRNLWVFDIAEEKEHRITEEDFRIGSFDVSPNGRRIAYTARRENLRNQQYLGEIFLLDLDDSTTTQLTTNRAPETGVLWAPDGIHLAYRAVSDAEWEQNQSKLWIMNVDTREHRMLSGRFEGGISRAVWTPDGRHILFNGRRRTNSNLFRLEVESGDIEQLTDVTGTMNIAAFSEDRTKMVYSFHDFDTPPDLYVSSTNAPEPTRITSANPSVETDFLLAGGEVITWRSADGLEIEGVLMLPDGYEPGTRLPLLLHVHGGPAGAFTNSFRSSYHVWAGLGYAQLLPNVRGSSGYGDGFLQGNFHDIGGGDYQDLLTGVDHVIEAGYADPDQTGIRGWSYGGILGGWTITQTGRFKGASLGAMVSDWTSEYAPGFNHDVRLWYLGGTPWENSEAWREMSPLTHVANVTTPTLLMHGINDRTDTEPQSMMFFTAIRDQGKIARYIKFPREPHGFREPRHQRIRDVEEIRWIQKHVRGIEWTPWVRPKAEEKPPVISSR